MLQSRKLPAQNSSAKFAGYFCQLSTLVLGEQKSQGADEFRLAATLICCFGSGQKLIK
jgi:hypothetical protein